MRIQTHPNASHPMTRRSIAGLAVFTLLLLTGATAVLAADHVNASTGQTLAGGPLALRGYDPVTYLSEGKPRLGKAEHSFKHEGAVYRFASAENQAAFEKNPERYVPMYGGFCAFGVSVGAKFDGDPEIFRVVDGKTYLNLNPSIQEKWEEDVRGNIHKADENWSEIRNRSIESLSK